MSSEHAVFTVVYPAALPYLGAMVDSVRAQRDVPTTFVAALDEVTERDVAPFLRELTTPVELITVDGTPAEVRNRALSEVCGRYAAVIFQDADDIARAGRFGHHLRVLETVDVSGHALRLVDEHGVPVGHTLTRPAEDLDDLLPRMNVFGFTNTAYRSSALADALPVPPDAVAVDWYVATRVRQLGSAMAFDPRSLADYRQHGGTTTRVHPPFSERHVAHAAEVAEAHLASLEFGGADPLSSNLRRRQQDLATFRSWTVERPEHVRRYVEALNVGTRRTYAWWEIVAQRELEHLWKT